MKKLTPSITAAHFPTYQLFREVCRKGLSVVRPLGAQAREADPQGWNYGQGFPPSYFAFGRMRALLAAGDALRLKPARVLEIAAGDGSLCAVLDAAGSEAVANDLRTDQLRQRLGTFTNGAKIQLAEGNALELGSEHDGQYDLVAACEIIEHVAHSVTFLKCLRRFLAPGGRILLTTPNGAYFRNRLPTHSQITDFTALESQQFKPDADGHLFFITPSELAGLALESDLEIETLCVWGTPFLTGFGGLSFARVFRTTAPAYWMEKVVQKLPARLRERLCFAMSAVLRPTDA